LWDPNPQFADLKFGIASVYRWKDDTGYQWTGGLVKPVDYVAGKRYPLVIQMYMFSENQFITDGTDPTAFAARHLASAGFVVLQIQKDMVHTFDDAEEQHHLRAFTSAVDRLTADGLVDPKSVGLVGFSITCQYVENALIRAPERFAAATIAEGTDHSYMQYLLLDVTSLRLRQQDEKINGSKPFGDGLKRWLDIAPGFHLDSADASQNRSDEPSKHFGRMGNLFFIENARKTSRFNLLSRWSAYPSEASGKTGVSTG
jgi:hypothetical protein